MELPDINNLKLQNYNRRSLLKHKTRNLTKVEIMEELKNIKQNFYISCNTNMIVQSEELKKIFFTVSEFIEQNIKRIEALDFESED